MESEYKKIGDLTGELKKLAMSRYIENEYRLNRHGEVNIDYLRVDSAFNWGKTLEGWDFWNNVCIGNITNLNRVFKIRFKIR